MMATAAPRITALRTTRGIPICSSHARRYDLAVRPARPDELAGCDFCVADQISVAAVQIRRWRTLSPTPSLDCTSGGGGTDGDDEKSDRINPDKENYHD